MYKRIIFSFFFLLIASPTFAGSMTGWMKVPEDLNINDEWIEANLCGAHQLSEMDSEWTAGFPKFTPGTVVVAGEKLINFTINTQSENPAVEVDAILIVCELEGWELMSLQTFSDPPTVYRQIPASMFDFQRERPVYDEDMNVIGYQPKTCNKWSRWYGQSEWVCE